MLCVLFLWQGYFIVSVASSTSHYHLMLSVQAQEELDEEECPFALGNFQFLMQRAAPLKATVAH